MPVGIKLKRCSPAGSRWLDGLAGGVARRLRGRPRALLRLVAVMSEGRSLLLRRGGPDHGVAVAPRPRAVGIHPDGGREHGPHPTSADDGGIGPFETELTGQARLTSEA